MPIIALPELKSSVFALSATAFGTISTALRSLGSSGCGLAVFRRRVYGSTARMSVIWRTKTANEAGLFGTLGTRLKVAMTSSAVKSLPSCHFHALAQANSHSVSR